MVRIGRIDAACGFDVNYGSRGFSWDSYSPPPINDSPEPKKRGRPKQAAPIRRVTTPPVPQAIEGGSDLPTVEI